MVATEFCDDDEGYLQWIGANPDGYVLNTFRKPAASYLILHRGTCGSISGIPSRGQQWTTGYIKVCAAERTELERWAKDTTGGTLSPCQLCKA